MCALCIGNGKSLVARRLSERRGSSLRLILQLHDADISFGKIVATWIKQVKQSSTCKKSDPLISIPTVYTNSITCNFNNNKTKIFKEHSVDKDNGTQMNSVLVQVPFSLYLSLLPLPFPIFDLVHVRACADRLIISYR